MIIYLKTCYQPKTTKCEIYTLDKFGIGILQFVLRYLLSLFIHMNKVISLVRLDSRYEQNKN